jgi:hypothetical protein
LLQTFALSEGSGHLLDEAQQALEEWWLPGASHRRPRPEDVAALRSAPVVYHAVERSVYRLTLPASLTSSGARHIAEELRTVEVWSGLLCGDAPTIVAINLMPLAGRHLRQIMERAATGLRAASVKPRSLRVPGARRSECLDGLTRGHSPTEPERITIVAAVVGQEVVLLTIRSWPRADVERAMERIVGTFEILARRRESG